MVNVQALTNISPDAYLCSPENDFRACSKAQDIFSTTVKASNMLLGRLKLISCLTSARASVSARIQEKIAQTFISLFS